MLRSKVGITAMMGAVLLASGCAYDGYNGGGYSHASANHGSYAHDYRGGNGYHGSHGYAERHANSFRGHGARKLDP